MVPKYLLANLVSRLGIDVSRSDRGKDPLSGRSQDGSAIDLFRRIPMVVEADLEGHFDGYLVALGASREKGSRSLFLRPSLRRIKCFSQFHFADVTTA